MARRLSGQRLIIQLLAIGACVLAADTVRAEGGVVGRVASLEGHVTAQLPGGAPRTLACGDPLRAGEHLVTDKNSHVALAGNGLYTRVTAGSQLRIQRQPGAGLELILDRGGMRVLDSRQGEALSRTRLLTPSAEALAGRRDVEVLVRAGGSQSEICAWGAAIEGEASDSSGCTVVERFQAVERRAVEAPRISLATADECGWRVELSGLAADLEPPAVSAGLFDSTESYEIASAFDEPICGGAGAECGVEPQPQIFDVESDTELTVEPVRPAIPVLPEFD